MTTYIASVRDKETKEIKQIIADYANEKVFREDLLRYGKGYSIRFIAAVVEYNE